MKPRLAVSILLAAGLLTGCAPRYQTDAVSTSTGSVVVVRTDTRTGRVSWTVLAHDKPAVWRAIGP